MEKLNRDEWETHIYLNGIDCTAEISTGVPKDINKCRKLGYEVIRENKYPDGQVYEVVFKVPRRCISFRGLKKITVSEEQRERARARALKYRFGKT